MPEAVKIRTALLRLGEVTLEGNVTVPEGAQGVIVFAHGSGSSRHSPRNRFVARVLNEGGLGTLLFDLLTPEEEALDLLTRRLRFDIGLLADRLVQAIDWLGEQATTRGLKAGLFGSSTGGSAALVAAAQRPHAVGAVVCRGSRTDLAGPAIRAVTAPTLLVVGEYDAAVWQINRQSLAQLSAPRRLEIIGGATHLFEEPGALEQVARLAREWFQEHLGGALDRDAAPSPVTGAF